MKSPMKSQVAPVSPEPAGTPSFRVINILLKWTPNQYRWRSALVTFYLLVTLPINLADVGQAPCLLWPWA